MWYYFNMDGKRILIVEDEAEIADIVRAYLEREGFKVFVAKDGKTALSVLKRGFDLIILDLMLPDIQGEEICKAIRGDSDIPIIILTAKSDEETKIKGLGIGADDYIVKPFSPRELVARIKALIRRAYNSRRYSFNNRDLIIDVNRFEVKKGGSLITLTQTEFNLLRYLAEHPDQIFTRLQLVNIILGYDFDGYDRTIDAHIKNIRHKIEDDPREPVYIKTIYGVGYKFIGIPDED